MTLLDTDTFTLYSYDHPSVVRRADEHALNDLVLIPLPTRIEALRGRFESIMKAADSNQLLRAVLNLAKTEAALAKFDLISIDSATAAKFDELRQVKALRSLSRGDLLIACIALAHDALLVSRNLKDFRKVSSLRVENWAD